MARAGEFLSEGAQDAARGRCCHCGEQLAAPVSQVAVTLASGRRQFFHAHERCAIANLHPAFRPDTG